MDEERDADRVKIKLDPETALRALLAVDPESEPVDDENERERVPDEGDDERRR